MRREFKVVIKAQPAGDKILITVSAFEGNNWITNELAVPADGADDAVHAGIASVLFSVLPPLSLRDAILCEVV